MSLTSLFEITYSEAPHVDRDAGVIRGVRILGRASRNGREYSDAALQQAARLYEGIGVNLNHPSRPQGEGARLVEDGFGWLQGVALRPDGVYGDLHYFRAHPAAEVIVEAAVRNPRRFGLSHHAEGAVVRQGGKLVVESIESVRSVDLVQNPATTNGLFESEAEPANRTVREVLESVGGSLAELVDTDEYRERIEALELVMKEGDESTQVGSAVCALVLDLLEDEVHDPTTRLGHAERWLGAWSGATTREADSDSILAGLTERLERIELENRCRNLLESRQRECGPDRIQELMCLPSDEERERLVESWPEQSVARTPAPRPAVSRPLYESGEDRRIPRFPEDTRAFVAALR